MVRKNKMKIDKRKWHFLQGKNSYITKHNQQKILKYLGDILSKDYMWTEHISSVASKEWRVLHIINAI